MQGGFSSFCSPNSVATPLATLESSAGRASQPAVAEYDSVSSRDAICRVKPVRVVSSTSVQIHQLKERSMLKPESPPKSLKLASIQSREYLHYKQSFTVLLSREG